MKTATPQLTILLALLSLGACAGSDNQAETANTAAEASSSETPDFQASCVEVFVRQRSCTDDFIPALLDARIRLDVPAGIADRASTEGRDALVAEAMSEWANDSQDAAIETTCEKISTSVPAETLEPMITATRECLQESECSAFATCVVPIIESQLQ